MELVNSWLLVTSWNWLIVGYWLCVRTGYLLVTGYKLELVTCWLLVCLGTGYFLVTGYDKNQIAIKNLNKPIDEIITFPRLNKYAPGVAAWNPNTYNKNICALASGVVVELLIWKNYLELCPGPILKSHTRVVTDINWHPLDPQLIVSTSLDTLTYIWDIRDYQKPVISLSSFAPASQVKWNKISRHILATVHNGDVKIWDKRKISSPVHYISAHLTNIHCMDWCVFKENQFSTASQDGTIKFFDISNPQTTECVINTEAPVWKACYTPFGRGMLVIIIPTPRKIENTLLLWNLSNNSVPLHTFVGHSEIVLDFQWRHFPQDGSDYQLITWSKDQTLRIWEIDKYLQELCGTGNSDLDIDCVDYISEMEKENPVVFGHKLPDEQINVSIYEKENDLKYTNGSTKNEKSEIQVKNLIRDINSDSASSSEINAFGKSSTITAIAPLNLQQEFSTNINIPNVQILKTDIIRRMCCTTAKCNGQIISLLINFPPSYPRNKGPIFRFAQGTTVSNAVRFKILEALRDTADFKVKNNQACLEACLRTLIVTMQKLTSNDAEKVNLFSDERLSTHGNSQDIYYVPARTCGAKFCFVDRLICFVKPLSQLQSSDKNICGLVSLSYRQTEALTRLYLQNKNGTLPPRTKYMIRRGLLKRMKNTRQNKRTVLIYDVSSLFFLNKELALKYKLIGSDINDICKYNAQIANSMGRRDLQQIWNLVLISAKNTNTSCSGSIDWNCHPLAKEMLQSIILFYISQTDLQTAATLCCVFQEYLFKRDSSNLKQKSNKTTVVNTPNPCTYREWLSEPSGSPYHTLNPIESSVESAWSFPTRKHVRSSSWSDFLEDIKLSNSIEHGEMMETNDMTLNYNEAFKYESNELLFDRVQKAYADILYRWQLLSVRALVMKSVKSANTEPHKGMEFKSECGQCKTSTFGKMCLMCKLPTMYCVICRLSVKGLASLCVRCNHGGHLSHMKKWYETETFCPVGCACQCSMNFVLTTS
ncbi:hypothetical protein PGB90_006417 [Kerria lacca]